MPEIIFQIRSGIIFQGPVLLWKTGSGARGSLAQAVSGRRLFITGTDTTVSNMNQTQCHDKTHRKIILMLRSGNRLFTVFLFIQCLCLYSVFLMCLSLCGCAASLIF